MAVDVEDFYTQYGPMVLRRCRALLKDEDHAMDAMQETFVNLLTHQDRLDASAPSSLLYRMATNICLNRIRTNKRRPETRDDELLLRIAAAPEAEQRGIARRMLDAIFATERESTRTIEVLHLVDGLTLEEVAAEVGMSVSGVRKRLRTLKANVLGLERV